MGTGLSATASPSAGSLPGSAMRSCHPPLAKHLGEKEYDMQEPNYAARLGRVIHLCSSFFPRPPLMLIDTSRATKAAPHPLTSSLYFSQEAAFHKGAGLSRSSVHALKAQALPWYPLPLQPHTGHTRAQNSPGAALHRASLLQLPWGWQSKAHPALLFSCAPTAGAGARKKMAALF